MHKQLNTHKDLGLVSISILICTARSVCWTCKNLALLHGTRSQFGTIPKEVQSWRGFTGLTVYVNCEGACEGVDVDVAEETDPSTAQHSRMRDVDGNKEAREGFFIVVVPWRPRGRLGGS